MSTLNIHQRLHAAMGDVDYIQKEKRSGMRYSIVSHDAVTAKVRPVLHKHGIVYYPVALEPGQVGNRTHVALTVRFANVDDPADFIDVPSLGYGIDDQDKGPGKAISYAVKYALLKALGLETGDDPDLEQDRKHIPFQGDPIREARETVATDDPHLLVNGETRSAYAVNKEKNGGKTPYQLNKEADEWVSKAKAAIAGMTSELEISEWWDERMKEGGSLDRLKKAHPKKFTDLWSVAEERIAQVQRVPRDRNVMEAG